MIVWGDLVILTIGILGLLMSISRFNGQEKRDSKYFAGIVFFIFMIIAQIVVIIIR